MTAIDCMPSLPFTGDPARTCVYCGREEWNDWLVTNNHGNVHPSWGNSECTSMSLTRNHVLYDIAQVEQARWQLENAGHKQLAARRGDLEHTQATLRRSLTRVREVWPDLTMLYATLAARGITASRIAEALS